MTLKLFKRFINTESNDQEELLSLLEVALNDGVVDMLQYAQIKSDINIKYRQELSNNNTKTRASYSKEQVTKVLKSHLDVYDGIKDLSAHLNFMQQLFGEESSQLRNGVQYNRNFHKTLNDGEANLGQSMPANWADETLELVKDRSVQFKNTLEACQKIYNATDNGNMLSVIQKWRDGG